MPLTQRRLIWSAFALSAAAMFAVTRLVPPPPPGVAESIGPILTPAAVLIALSNLGLSFVLPRFLPDRRSAFLVSVALCESAALFGVVLHLTAGWENAWMLFVAALIGLAIHYPRRG